MKTLLIHLISFYQVIAVNCVQPVNWKYCYRVDQWLIPDLIQGYKIWSEQECERLHTAIGENESVDHETE